MAITDWPADERPREKLLAHGAGHLSDAELLAIFLTSGVVGRNVIQVAGDLLEKYGSLQELGSQPVSEYMNNNGIGLAKACKLAAAFELGSRVSRERIRSVKLDTPELIYDHFSHQMSGLANETAVVVTLNARMEHTSSTTISVGTVSETSAHPREVLRPAITRSAFGFILLHNHPSGDPTPSAADYRITENLLRAAEIIQIRMVDHLIIGRPAAGRMPYFSFRSGGLIP